MKISFLTLLFITAWVNGHSKHIGEKRKDVAECMKGFGLTELPKEPPNLDDRNIACFYACVVEKEGMIVDGKFIIEEESEREKEDPYDPTRVIMENCMKTANKENDVCDVAATMIKCFQEKVPRRHHPKY